jgi:hypothetical protein
VIQILKDEGWMFIDNGNQINSAINESLGETVLFESSTDLENWIHEKAEILL